MALHPSAIARIVDALAQTLLHGRVRSVRQDGDQPETLLLECRTPGQNHWLAITTAPPEPTLVVFHQKRAAPQTPSGFVMGLRKHLEGLRVARVEHTPQTRRVAFAFASGASDVVSATLVADLADTHPNLYLLDENGRLRATASAAAAHAVEAKTGEPLPNAPSLRATDEPDELQTWPTEPDDLWPFLEERARKKHAEWRYNTTQKGAARRIRQALRRNARTLQKVEGDLARAERAETLRHEADLLQSARGQVPRGATEIALFDWARQDGEKTRIPLDPARSLAEEIERRYRTYRRLRAAEDRILERLETLETHQEALQHALHEVERIQDPDAIEKITAQLERQRLLPRHDEAKRVRERQRQPWREARSSDGFRILVGRGARDNDTLTFRVARGRDLWLHARESSGSHVIIIREREAPVPERTLHEAATLAAYYSSARRDTRVDVGWTERKHVSRPSGAPPGRVSVASMRNILVTPDEALVHTLLGNARDDETSA